MIRQNLPKLPYRISRLPVDDRGYPVPYFVTWIDGKPDFRIADARKMVKAVKEKLCWICGEKLGVYLAFTIGPMGAINRISSEPPAHLECAEFAARACPFLTTPHEKRRENRVPDGAVFSETGLKRNPGVALVWVTKKFSIVHGAGAADMLFRIGDPTRTLWFCEDRDATRDEVLHSVETGLPSLRELAENDGADVVQLLEKWCKDAEKFYPQE